MTFFTERRICGMAAIIDEIPISFAEKAGKRHANGQCRARLLRMKLQDHAVMRASTLKSFPASRHGEKRGGRALRRLIYRY